MDEITIKLLHRELSELGADAEIAYTGDGWSARVTIKVRQRWHTRLSEHGSTAAAAKRACAAGVNAYLRSWGEQERAAATIAEVV